MFERNGRNNRLHFFTLFALSVGLASLSISPLTAQFDEDPGSSLDPETDLPDPGFDADDRPPLDIPTRVPVRPPRQEPPERTEPQGGICPQGMHIMQRSGEPGTIDPSLGDYDDADHVCVRDEDPASITCSGRGTATLVGGLAVCACDVGYAGVECEKCQPGYEEGRTGGCVPEAPRDPGTPEVAGVAESLEAGEVRTLQASSTLDTSFEWTIIEGEGCFLDPASGGCGSTVVGRSADFQAPSFVDELAVTRIEVKPLCCNVPSNHGLWIVPNGSIPVTGYGDSRLEPILRALRQFMKHRCVGAGVIGVSRYGKPIGLWGLGRMDGRASQVLDPACGDETQNPFVASAERVRWDTPMRGASVSKPITAAVARWVLKKRWAELDPQAEADGMINDDSLEKLSLLCKKVAVPCFPEALLSDELRALLGGETEVPYAYSDEDCGDLPADFQGRIYADGKWKDVRIADALAHGTGMAKNHAGTDTNVNPNLARIRGLTTSADLIAHEEELRTEWGNAAIDDAKNALGLGSEVYFLKNPNANDMLTTAAGRCLPGTVGMTQYSNFSPGLLQEMIERHDPSGRFAADVGYPERHAGSALDRFFAEEVGIATTSSSGVFVAQTVVGLEDDVPPYSDPMPVRRHWKASQETYYPNLSDKKRPHCEWDGVECSGTNWKNNPSNRIDWTWKKQWIPFGSSEAMSIPASWGLAFEAKAALAFMAKYWTQGYAPSNPKNLRVGEKRNGVWNVSTSHGGAWRGARAFALQYATNSERIFKLPPRDQGGNILDDFDNLQTYECSLPNGNTVKLPDGVDIFVAINQRRDKKCLEAGTCIKTEECIKNKTCKDDYSLFGRFVKYGVCRVNWSSVMNPNILMPDD